MPALALSLWSLTLLPAIVIAAVGCQSPQPTAATSSSSVERTVGPRAMTPSQIQSQVMSFADNYMNAIAESAGRVIDTTDDPALRRQAHNMALASISGAVTIAAEANPVVSTLDMAALLTMQRMVFERHWSPQVFGNRGDMWLKALRELEASIWEHAALVATGEELAELRGTVEAFVNDHPNITQVSQYRLGDIRKARGISIAAPARSTSIFRLLYLDPLANLDPTARELMESRLLGERAFYYAKRLPFLLDWHVESLILDVFARPELLQLLANAETFTQSAEQAGRTLSDLPLTIEREREALLDALDERQQSLGALATDLRATIEAATALSESMQVTIASADAFQSRLDADRDDAEPSQPLDIHELRATINDATTTVREMNELVQSVQSLLAPDNRPAGQSPIADATGSVKSDVQAMIDRAFVRGLWLLVVLFFGIIVTWTICRLITNRLRPRGVV